MNDAKRGGRGPRAIGLSVLKMGSGSRRADIIRLTTLHMPTTLISIVLPAQGLNGVNVLGNSRHGLIKHGERLELLPQRLDLRLHLVPLVLTIHGLCQGLNSWLRNALQPWAGNNVCLHPGDWRKRLLLPNAVRRTAALATYLGRAIGDTDRLCGEAFPRFAVDLEEMGGSGWHPCEEQGEQEADPARSPGGLSPLVKECHCLWWRRRRGPGPGLQQERLKEHFWLVQRLFVCVDTILLCYMHICWSPIW